MTSQEVAPEAAQAAAPKAFPVGEKAEEVQEALEAVLREARRRFHPRLRSWEDHPEPASLAPRTALGQLPFQCPHQLPW